MLAGAGVARADDEGCLSCHTGIEEMHPWQPLSCTDCHGGDGQATDLGRAHVSPRVGWHGDERVRSSGFELEYARFRNPSDLRVVDSTCGSCHAAAVETLRKSLHGTTAGHLNDGLYENGVNATRAAVYAVFAVEDDQVQSPHGLSRLRSVEELRSSRRASDSPLAPHAADLPRKSCMECHLYSEGVGMAGRLGQDGQYRGEGCAACHVVYAEDGMSRTDDAAARRFDPGHPLKHQLVTSPPTSTCTSCHVGDASIGNGFRGLAQLYPNMPAGPDVPGTTDRLIARQFFLSDPVRLPPDLHHAAGMDCIDCHSAGDVMGDGDIYGAMEHAVAVECVTCHGSFDQTASLRDGRGRNLSHVERSGDLVVLRSKLTDQAHRVKQAAHVVDAEHPDFNPRAAHAMTAEHARLECYACHSGWNTNFFGFHFDRNEAFSQLDLIHGKRTPGVVSTGERVFATLRQHTLGLSSEGEIAPYMVGFSSMGTVHAADGSLLLDQGLPETAAGLSGMSMIHHQPHTNQPVARSCVECHRSPATLGLGTGGDTGGSFALARGLIVVAGERGLETLLLDRQDPIQSVLLARLPLGGANAVVLDSDRVSGHASTAFVAQQSAGVTVVDVSNPAFPTPRSFIAAGDVRDLLLLGDVLVIANGKGGLRLVNVADRDQPVLLSDLPTREARALSAQWPRLYVADGPGGLLVVDIADTAAPRAVGRLALGAADLELDDDASDVATLFQYGRPDGPHARTEARLLVAVANGTRGLALVDGTHPEHMLSLLPAGRQYAETLALRSVELTGRYELGDTTGVEPTRERDMLYMGLGDDERGFQLVLDVTDPAQARRVDGRGRATPVAGRAVLMRSFNPPVLVTRLLVPHATGLGIFNVTDSEVPFVEATLTPLGALSAVAVEAFAFDRMADESGRALKDVSHEGARFLSRDEMLKVLSVPTERLLQPGSGRGPGRSAAAVGALADAAIPGGHIERGLPARPVLPEPDSETMRRLRLGYAVGPDESLAQLLRSSDFTAQDKNGDRCLSRGELERLLFDLLDVNADGRLDLLEWPRIPDADPERLDRNGDEQVSKAEMDVSRELMGLLDLDGDGLVQEREWPFVVLDDPMPTLSYATLDAVREVINRIGWAKQYPRLYARIAGSVEVKPHDVPDERITNLIEQARRLMLRDLSGETVVGDFVLRYDLDQDGAVEPSEFEPFWRVAERIDLNADGKVDGKDRPQRSRR